MVKDILIGIMQGRLLAPIHGRLQSFPGKNWEKEFSLAHECGIDAIEFIFDRYSIKYNPLHSNDKVRQIQMAYEKYKVKVISVCADYFKVEGFIRVNDLKRLENIRMLETLTFRCSEIGINYIVIPFLEQSEVRTEEDLAKVQMSLLTALKHTKGCEVVYALEMSLPTEKIVSFLEDVNHPRLKINYDTGNSTAQGHDVISEIEQLAPWIVGIHIKDRKIGGGSCILGNGDTDFDGAFDALARINFHGPFILEAQRGNDGVETAKQYLNFLKDKIDRYYTKAP